MCKGLYSPKIAEQHIPTLYKLAKELGITMTKLVDKIISEYLLNRGGQ